MTSPPNGWLCVFVSVGLCARGCVFVGHFAWCVIVADIKRNMSSHLLCFVLHHNAKWLKDKLTFIKILHTCHGLKEINRRKLIVDASNTRRGSCEHRSTLCMIKNPHFSFFPSLLTPSSLLYPSCLIFSTSKHLLSGSVASPSMLSPASRAQRNSRIVFFFCPLPPLLSVL